MKDCGKMPIYPLVVKIAIENTPFIVDLSNKKGDFPYLFVCLPEGSLVTSPAVKPTKWTLGFSSDRHVWHGSATLRQTNLVGGFNPSEKY